MAALNGSIFHIYKLSLFVIITVITNISCAQHLVSRKFLSHHSLASFSVVTFLCKHFPSEHYVLFTKEISLKHVPVCLLKHHG